MGSRGPTVYERSTLSELRTRKKSFTVELEILIPGKPGDPSDGHQIWSVVSPRIETKPDGGRMSMLPRSELCGPRKLTSPKGLRRSLSRVSLASYGEGKHADCVAVLGIENLIVPVPEQQTMFCITLDNGIDYNRTPYTALCDGARVNQEFSL